MVRSSAQAWNPSIWEADTGESRVQRQPKLHSKIITNRYWGRYLKYLVWDIRQKNPADTVQELQLSVRRDTKLTSLRIATKEEHKDIA